MISSLLGMNCFSLGDSFENCSLFTFSPICLWLSELWPLSLSWVSALTWPLCVSDSGIPPEQLHFRLNILMPAPISLFIQATQNTLEWPFSSHSSHLVCCSTYIFSVSPVFTFNISHDFGLYFLPGLFCSLLVFFFLPFQHILSTL